jgi:hypothetical protein
MIRLHLVCLDGYGMKRKKGYDRDGLDIMGKGMDICQESEQDEGVQDLTIELNL